MGQRVADTAGSQKQGRWTWTGKFYINPSILSENFEDCLMNIALIEGDEEEI